MDISRTKRMIFTGAASIGVLGGAAGIAGAVTGPASPSPAAARDNVADPAYRSSVTAPEAPDGQEKDEAAKLQSLASVTAEQARAAALGAVPGSAKTPELDNENGNVVWSVEVTKADGTVSDVKVDAGTGKVLAQESDSESDDGNEKEAGTETPDGPGSTEAPSK